MTKIHKLENSAQYYYDKAVESTNKGDYVQSLDYLYRAYSLDDSDKKYELFIEMGACYALLGEHNSALKSYYKALAFDSKNEQTFVGIISSLIAKNQNPEAVYYINYSNAKNIIGEDYDVKVSNNTDNFKVVGKYDREAVIYVARKLIKNGELEYAKSILEKIPEQSKDYIEALNLIAMINLSQEKYIQSALVCDSVLAKEENNVYALTSKIVAFHYLKNYVERDKLVEKLDNVCVKTEKDIKKVAICMQQIKNNELTLKYYQKLFEINPYDKNTNLILALLYHNNGKNSLAHSILVKLAKLYPDCEIIKFYAVELMLNKNKEYEVIVDIPSDIQEQRFNYINEKLTQLKTVERLINYCKKHEEFLGLLRWILWSPQVKIAGHIAKFLAQNKYFHPLLRQLLVDPDVNYLPKRECLATLLKYAQKKNFALFVQTVVQFFTPRQPKFKVDERIDYAYWEVYSLCVFLLEDNFDKSLNSTYKKFAKKCEFMINSGAEVDEISLSVLFANKLQIHPLFADTKYLCKLLDCDLNRFNKVLDIYNNLEIKND